MSPADQEQFKWVAFCIGWSTLARELTLMKWKFDYPTDIKSKAWEYGFPVSYFPDYDGG